MKHVKTHKESVARKKARATIIEKANQHRAKDLKPFRQRTIQQAVHHARHHQLVKPEVLKKAGYR